MKQALLSSSRSLRLTALLMTALLLLLATAVAGQASQPDSIQLTVVGPETTIFPGQTFVATVHVSGGANLGAFELGPQFDQNLLTTQADWLNVTPYLASSGRTVGVLRLPAAQNVIPSPMLGAYSYGAGAGPTGAGDLATIQFRATAPGMTSLGLAQVQLTDINANVQTVTVTPFTIRVQPQRFYLPVVIRR